MSAPLSEVLQVALQSHRVALCLDQENADTLFNTAQVLTSLAELVTESKRPSDDQLAHGIKFLQEALELFQRCLTLQELRFTESQEMQSMESDPANQPEMSAPDTGEQDDQSQEQWVTVVEPVTKDTLVDTAVAQLEALTALCNLLTFNPDAGVAWVEEYSSELLRSKLVTYIEGSSRQYEACIARAKYTCGLSEVLYRGRRIDFETYHREVARAYESEVDPGDPDGLCSKADAFTSLNAALAEMPPSDTDALNKSVTVRWQVLSSALDALTTASKIRDAENLPKIHIARGDVELHRWRLGFAPWNHAMAQQNGGTLIRNAQTYYRGAAALARRDGAVEEERDGTCKEALAAGLEGQKDKLEQLKTTFPKEVLAVAEDMADDGFVTPADMEAMLS